MAVLDFIVCPFVPLHTDVRGNALQDQFAASVLAQCSFLELLNERGVECCKCCVGIVEDSS